MKINFIQTGGTIDKDYIAGANNHGYNFVIDKPASEMILKKIKPNFDYSVESISKKDSLDLTNEDRNKILLFCRKSLAKKIIITHGTDTILQTAEKLSVIADKTIVLTGAMRPASCNDSDAAFNIGVAVGGIQNLKYGIYIAMRGIIYSWQDYRNN
ncbi:asparaginase [Candidatus Falkowbacteria bacterium CG10_big_fil_rev_8_21_14_0_10_37_6]|uniref:Asparaginase n=1 Tax=Candidatus Falkowbacteria bacterium CG10_big_fil_rev_8_21_14_0_10_37_6 TaxID=1974563 RepID=A0A2H0V759_9BACT|nr:MAG: asparaginase [Candidatus Falkowbacteria bacterium CG10_big_fil_rev_8_21_14_0_10_37_6]